MGEAGMTPKEIGFIVKKFSPPRDMVGMSASAVILIGKRSFRYSCFDDGMLPSSCMLEYNTLPRCC